MLALPDPAAQGASGETPQAYSIVGIANLGVGDSSANARDLIAGPVRHVPEYTSLNSQALFQSHRCQEIVHARRDRPWRSTR